MSGYGPPAQQPHQQPSRPPTTPEERLALLGYAAAALGVLTFVWGFLDWYTASGNTSIGGYSPSGGASAIVALSLVAGIITAARAFEKKPVSVAPAAMAVVAALIALGQLIGKSNFGSGSTGDAIDLGIGLILALITTIVQAALLAYVYLTTTGILGGGAGGGGGRATAAGSSARAAQWESSPAGYAASGSGLEQVGFGPGESEGVGSTPSHESFGERPSYSAPSSAPSSPSSGDPVTRPDPAGSGAQPDARSTMFHESPWRTEGGPATAPPTPPSGTPTFGSDSPTSAPFRGPDPQGTPPGGFSGAPQGPRQAPPQGPPQGPPPGSFRGPFQGPPQGGLPQGQPPQGPPQSPPPWQGERSPYGSPPPPPPAPPWHPADRPSGPPWQQGPQGESGWEQGPGEGPGQGRGQDQGPGQASGWRPQEPQQESPTQSFAPPSGGGGYGAPTPDPSGPLGAPWQSEGADGDVAPPARTETPLVGGEPVTSTPESQRPEPDADPEQDDEEPPSRPDISQTMVIPRPGQPGSPFDAPPHREDDER